MGTRHAPRCAIGRWTCFAVLRRCWELVPSGLPPRACLGHVRLYPAAKPGVLGGSPTCRAVGAE
eukprot:558611-Alexandrium_andersonii.AAC.1